MAYTPFFVLGLSGFWEETKAMRLPKRNAVVNALFFRVEGRKNLPFLLLLSCFYLAMEVIK